VEPTHVTRFAAVPERLGFDVGRLAAWVRMGTGAASREAPHRAKTG
jgi:hypothetical protein